MKNLRISTISMVALLLCAFIASAQRPPSKTLSFDAKINDLIVNDVTGVAVIQTGGGNVPGGQIHGYAPVRREIIWTKDAPTFNVGNAATEALFTGDFKLATEDFTQVPQTPFVQKFFGSHLYVYNSITGDILFSTSGAEIYYQAEYIFDENAFLLRGIENEDLIVSKYSLEKKEIVWKTVVFNGFKNFLKLNFTGQQVGEDRIEYNEDKVFALIKTKFFVLDKATGKLLWKNVEPDLNDFKKSRDGSRLILIKNKGLLGGKSEIEFYNVTTGTQIWNDPIVTKRLVLYEDWSDKMLLAHYKGFNFYDYQTGEKLWPKDPKGKGIKSVIPIDKDFLYVYDDEVMLLNKDGQKLWKKDVKISDKPDEEVLYMDKTENYRVLYVTQSLANFIDYITGKKIWKGNIKLNEKRLTLIKHDKKSGDFLLFNDEKLYRFNEETSERPEELVKLKLKNEKLVTSMEIYDDMITISGQTEVVGVDNSGKVLFHNKYTQPGEVGRGFMKAGAIALGSASSISQMQAQVTVTYRDADGNEVASQSSTVQFNDQIRAVGKAGLMASDAAMKAVGNRFNAMQEDAEYAFIFAKGETGERLLIKVDKKTGEEVDKLVMDNTKPVYDIDRITQNIYYTKGSDLMVYESGE